MEDLNTVAEPAATLAPEANSIPGTSTTPELTAAQTRIPAAADRKKENLIYRVLRAGGADDVYLVHIDPSVLEGNRWQYQQIEYAVAGTYHVTVIDPEHYDGDITAEVTVTLDDSGNLIMEDMNNG